MEINLRYTCRERNRDGTWRYRFQRFGKKTTIQGEPGSPDFMAHYSNLLAGVDHAPAQAEARLVKHSIAWAVSKYLTHLQRQVDIGVSSPLTLKQRKSQLNRWVQEHGEYDIHMPKGKLVEYLDGFTDRPGERNNTRKSVSAVFEFLIERELLREGFENPARKVKPSKTATGGFYTCTFEDVQRYMHHHGPGTIQRRIMVVELCTAARRDDLRLLGPFNRFERDGRPWLRWTQSKAPHRTIEIPMLPMLVEEVKDVRDGVFCARQDGKPYSHAGIGNKVAQAFEAAKVRGSLHCVRKGLSSILAGMGAHSYEIDVLLGHEIGSAESKVYVAETRRTQLAETFGERLSGITW